MGIPTEILWEWDGNGNENSLPTATLIKAHTSLAKIVDQKPLPSMGDVI